VRVKYLLGLFRGLPSLDVGIRRPIRVSRFNTGSLFEPGSFSVVPNLHTFGSRHGNMYCPGPLITLVYIV
jgi:hypothetical protein